MDLLRQIRSGVYPPGARLPSEKELAAQYGVSRITTKKAMDELAAGGYASRTPGRGTFVLPPDTVAAVVKEAAALPSAAGEKRLIGVVMEKFSSSFGGELVLGIEQACSQLGYTMALRCTYHSEQAEEKAIAELLALGVSGMIIMCVYDETYNPLILKLSLEGFPVVLVDRELTGIPLPCVATDNRAAAKELTDRLFVQGHKHLTFVMAQRSLYTSTVRDRAEGFIQSCVEHGCSVDRRLWVTDLDNLDGVFTLERQREISRKNISRMRSYMLAHPEITGYVATSYEVAYFVQYADSLCSDSAKRCIVCFDAPDAAFHSSPMIYVRQGQREMGQTAVRYLLDRIQNKELPRMTCVPFEIME